MTAQASSRTSMAAIHSGMQGPSVDRHDGGPSWALFARFLAILVTLNFAWEIAQLPLYTIWQQGSWYEIGFAIVHCTGGDLLIATFCIIAAATPTRWVWPKGRKEHVAFLSIFLLVGVGYVIFSEWLNVSVRGSWAYSDLMPVLPPLNTGLSPLLQWLVLPPLGLWLAKEGKVRDLQSD